MSCILGGAPLMRSVSRLVNRIMRQTLRTFQIVTVIAIVSSALWLFFTLFHGERGPYTVVVRNDVPGTPLRSVGVRLKSNNRVEKFVYPIVEPGADQQSWHALSEWPVPTSITVDFADPSGRGHMVSITGAPPNFRGSICVVITKPSDYAAHLELKGQR